MGSSNSLEIPFYLGIIEKKLTNISKVKSLAFVFPPRAVRLTYNKVRERVKHEGIEFLTKSMPSLRKSLDKALSGEHRLDSKRFRKIPLSQLPMFMGELFQLVFDKDGWILQDPSADAVQQLRYVLDVFYKLETKHHAETDREVIAAFIATEDELIKPTSPLPHNGFTGSFQESVPPQSTDWGSLWAWQDRTSECRASNLRGSRLVEQRFGRVAGSSIGSVAERDCCSDQHGHSGLTAQSDRSRQPDKRGSCDRSIERVPNNTGNTSGELVHARQRSWYSEFHDNSRSALSPKKAGSNSEVACISRVDSLQTSGASRPEDNISTYTGRKTGWWHGHESDPACGTRERINRLDRKSVV